MSAVVKLGGSIITWKDKPYKVRLEMLREYARMFKRLVEEGFQLLLVLGGGSFGHYEVKRSTEAGIEPRFIVSRVSRAMTILGLIVARVFEEEGLPVVLYPPHAFCEPTGLKPGCRWSIVRRDIAAGILPVTYGDIVSMKPTYHIVSGDELAIEAACALGIGKVVYATDVPGVIIGGRLVERIDSTRLLSLVAEVGESGSVDVTGGMRRKLRAVLETGCRGLRVYILDGCNPGRVESVIRGHVSQGTFIEL